MGQGSGSGSAHALAHRAQPPFAPPRPRPAAGRDAGAVAVAVHAVDVEVDEGRHAVGGEGELWLRGPEQCIGYTDPARNGDAFAPGGWFRSGDVGVLDADGNVTSTDRLKDIIIRGGENLSSLEIEDLLQRHPAVAEAAAVGLPDPRYGERVCAFLILTSGASEPGIPDLIAHFAALGAAKQKTPERVVVVEDFPRTAAGKVKKNELRSQFAED